MPWQTVTLSRHLTERRAHRAADKVTWAIASRTDRRFLPRWKVTKRVYTGVG